MSNFRVGQNVVCVDASCTPSGCSDLTEGAVYTVRECRPWTFYGKTVIGVYLQEIVNPLTPDGSEEVAFRADRFRPAVTTDISIFTAMLAPQPEVVS